MSEVIAVNPYISYKWCLQFHWFMNGKAFEVLDVLVKSLPDSSHLTLQNKSIWNTTGSHDDVWQLQVSS